MHAKFSSVIRTDGNVKEKVLEINDCPPELMVNMYLNIADIVVRDEEAIRMAKMCHDIREQAQS